MPLQKLILRPRAVYNNLTIWDIQSRRRFIMHSSRVSIIVPTYNHENDVARALKSIVAQDCFQECAVFVSDDCSIDNTFQCALAVTSKHANIELKRTSRNLGWYGNYKTLLDRCETEYTAILKGDDVWFSPAKINRQIRYMDSNPKKAACFVDYYVMDKTTGCLDKYATLMQEKYRDLGPLDLLNCNYPATLSTCFYRTKQLKAVFDDLIDSQPTYDWVLNFILSEQAGIGFIPEPSVVYNIHQNGLWSGLEDVRRNELMLHSLSVMKKKLPKYSLYIDERKNSLLMAARNA